MAVESRDLSQADKSVFFPKAERWVAETVGIPNKLFGTWQFGKIYVLVNFIIQKFATLKSKHFSQFSGER